MAMSSLADRFQALQVQQKKAEFMSMSFDDLSQMRVSFGETKVNQTFLEVIEGDPKYVQWFAKKYQNSQKESHQAFLFFLSLYVERKELEKGLETPRGAPTSSHLKSKAKAKPAVKNPSEHGSQASWSDQEDPWDVMQGAQMMPLPIQEEIEDNRRRLSNMEEALTQITQQLQLLTQAAMGQKQGQ